MNTKKKKKMSKAKRKELLQKPFEITYDKDFVKDGLIFFD